MALPNTEKAQKLVDKLLIDAVKPIYPNLLRRQTSLEFITKKQAEIEGEFRLKIFDHTDPGFYRAVDAYYWNLI